MSYNPASAINICSTATDLWHCQENQAQKEHHFELKSNKKQ